MWRSLERIINSFNRELQAMYACILETGREFFEGVRTQQRDRQFPRPTPYCASQFAIRDR